MAAKNLLLLVILVITNPSLQDLADNNIDDDVFDEAKAAILKEQNAQNIGGMLNNLMQSDGAKQLGDMLLNAATGENGGQILQGLGSLLGQGNQGQGFDPSLLTAAMSFFQAGQSKKSGEGFDMGTIMSMLGGLTGQQGGDGPNLMSYLPMILQTVNAFVGPEADERAKSHSGHSNLMPAYLEKIHLYFDHFVNSDMAQKLVDSIGAEKLAKIFADEKGNFSYQKFVDMLENHSFRRHWISMLTQKIAQAVTFIADPQYQKKYMSTFQHFVNSILKTQGFPKSALFDPTRPTETISNIVNHVAKFHLKMKIDSKQYVKPAVEYMQDLEQRIIPNPLTMTPINNSCTMLLNLQTLLKLAQKKGIMKVDERQLSDKLADTINMEVIEPIARVNRAYRFALKVPKCDKYVMCLVNQEQPNDKPSLPGLKKALSKSASLISSWFLSSRTGTSFWSLYHMITDEDNCQARFLKVCNDFHVEEIKVTTEYVHNEL